MNELGIERAPGQYPVNDPTFTRDRHLLKTSAGGNGRRLDKPRALYLNAMTGLLPALGGTSDVESQGDNMHYAHCPSAGSCQAGQVAQPSHVREVTTPGTVVYRPERLHQLIQSRRT